MKRGKNVVQPYGTIEKDGKVYIIWQKWDFDGDQYALTMYFIEDDNVSDVAKTHVMRTRYYALSPDHLLNLMSRAGFINVQRLDEVFFQPVCVGTKPAA